MPASHPASCTPPKNRCASDCASPTWSNPANRPASARYPICNIRRSSIPPGSGVDGGSTGGTYGGSTGTYGGSTGGAYGGCICGGACGPTGGVYGDVTGEGASLTAMDSPAAARRNASTTAALSRPSAPPGSVASFSVACPRRVSPDAYSRISTVTIREPATPVTVVRATPSATYRSVSASASAATALITLPRSADVSAPASEVPVESLTGSTATRTAS